MATFNFFLIGISTGMDINSKDFVNSLGLPKGTTSWKAGQQWFGARRQDLTLLWYVMEAVSAKYKTEVIGIKLQSDAGSFEMRTFAQGKQLRKLVYAVDHSGWMAVQGQEQAWESQVFFSQEKLDSSLARAGNEQEKAKVNEIFNARKIVLGSAFPSAAEDSIAPQILAALGCRFPLPAKKKDAKPKHWLRKLLGF